MAVYRWSNGLPGYIEEGITWHDGHVVFYQDQLSRSVDVSVVVDASAVTSFACDKKIVSHPIISASSSIESQNNKIVFFLFYADSAPATVANQLKKIQYQPTSESSALISSHLSKICTEYVYIQSFPASSVQSFKKNYLTSDVCAYSSMSGLDIWKIYNCFADFKTYGSFDVWSLKLSLNDIDIAANAFIGSGGIDYSITEIWDVLSCVVRVWDGKSKITSGWDGYSFVTRSWDSNSKLRNR